MTLRRACREYVSIGNLGWGLGWATTLNEFESLSFGWSGAAATWFRAVPDEDMAVTFVTGMTSETLSEPAHAFMAQLASALVDGRVFFGCYVDIYIYIYIYCFLLFYFIIKLFSHS